MATTSPPPDDTDAQLIVRAREGDKAAYAALWARHSSAGYRYARRHVSAFDADDLVTEAYLQILRTLANGHGPTSEFRPYLLATIRNQAISWSRGLREVPLDTLDHVESPAGDASERVLADADARAVARAFRSLPPRWQRVLWLVEVEHVTPLAAARVLGMSANSVSSLTFRAREGLREAWVQMQVSAQPATRECAWAREHLGAYARQHLTARRQQRMASHLVTCSTCSTIAREVRETTSVLHIADPPRDLREPRTSGDLRASSA